MVFRRSGATQRLAVCLLGLAGIAALSCRPAVPTIEAFDEIVDEAALRQGFPAPPATTFGTEIQAQQRTYTLRIPAAEGSQGPVFVCAVLVSPAGTLLTEERWNERRQMLKQAYPDRDSEFFENEFPSMGLRAMREAAFAGPGGASEGLTFTTHDGRFDVRLTAANRAPDTVALPGYDLLGVGRRIADQYQRRYPG